MSRFSALSFLLTLGGLVLILVAYSGSMSRAEHSAPPLPALLVMPEPNVEQALNSQLAEILQTFSAAGLYRSAGDAQAN